MRTWKKPVHEGSSKDEVFEDPGKELNLILARLFDMILPFGFAFGGLSLCFSLYRSLHYGWYKTMAMHLIMYLTAMVILFFRRRLPNLFIFTIFMILVGLDTIQSLFVFGLAGPSITNLAVMGIMTGVFVGVRECTVVMVAGVTTVAGIAAAICSGLVGTSPEILTHLTAPINWIVQISCMIMYVFPLVFAVQGMKKRLMGSLCELKITSDKMQQEIVSRADAEEKLRESEIQYRSIFENIIEGIFQINSKGKLLKANPSFARIAGFDSTLEVLSRISNFPDQLIVDLEDRAVFYDLMSAPDRVEAFETRLRRKDGSIIWVSINGRTLSNVQNAAVCFEGTMEDVTQRKTAEIAHRESEDQYRSVVESAIFGFCIIQNGRFQFVNRQFCDIMGYTEEEIIAQKKPLDLIHPEHKEDIAKIIEDNATGVTFRQFDGELRIIDKKGKIKTIRVSSNPFYQHGRPAACVSIADITNEKELEGQLLHAQKMEALGTLTGGIAHDFNNILTALLGFGNILQTELGDDDPRRIYADQIISAASKASNLTQSLLTFSRKQPIRLKPIDLNEHIKGTKKLLARLMTEDIEFSTYFTKESTVVLADAVQMDQILFNLATNARDAMQQGGKFILQTDLVDLDKRFVRQHGFGRHGRYVLLSVSDTGTGINKETIAKIFDPFFTTKGQGKGTGLGLSTVYGIVQQHDGFITMYSEPGHGTTCHIYLPAIDTEACKEIEKLQISEQGRETILIAEDDEYVSLLMKDILARYGYKILHAVNGDEAVAQFKGHPEVNLAILDTIMPGKNGKEVFDEIKGLRPDIKAIFTSGYASSVLLEKGIQQNSSNFLKKPFSQQELMQMVRHVLDTV